MSQQEYDNPVSYDPLAEAEDALAITAQEELEEEIFFDYEDRGCCPVCSIQEGHDVAIPPGKICEQCGGWENDADPSSANVGLSQTWKNNLAVAYRKILAKCTTGKVCHKTESAAVMHCEHLAKRFGYRSQVYFHNACGSFHVGDSTQNYKRKI